MNRKNKKDYLISLIKQSDLPTVKLNTVRMKYEEIDLEKVADFLLDKGVDINITNTPYYRVIESCLEPIDNTLMDMYGVDIHEYDKDEFVEHFCHRCGSQRCEGIGTPWFEECQYKEHLKDYK